ncbi:MAG: aminodeoxychorismate/anthranilate synthase component II [Clostridia bacterium]|nr:aminodeoxychorismate/anthranilate synthase component II [Clostridia bacterium]
MIALIDNYDSFSYNLYQLIGEQYPDIKVFRNNGITVEELGQLNPFAIVLSPGPGKPQNAGICIEAVKRLGSKIPILGVCLGHQAICEAYGGKVTYASRIMHGKQSEVFVTGGRLFSGLGASFPAARYHSLEATQLPEELMVTAITKQNEIMAVEHKKYPVFGLQFHPESILTPNGKKILSNFLKLAGAIND